MCLLIITNTHTHTHTHTPEQSCPSSVRTPPQEVRWSHSQKSPKYGSVKFLYKIPNKTLHSLTAMNKYML